MTTSTPDLAKLQNLIATATNPRQKAMYQKLLEKAKKQLGESQVTLSTEKEGVNKSKTKSKSKKLVKNQIETKNQKLEPKSEEFTQEVKEVKESTSDKSKIKSTKDKSNKNKSKSKTQELATTKKSSFRQKSKSKDSSKSDLEAVEAVVEEEKEQPEKIKNTFFQAIGVIEGTINLEEDRQLSIAIEGQKYHLGYSGGKKKPIYDALLEEIEREGGSSKLISVYPQFKHDNQKKEYQLSFTLVGVSKSERKKALFKKLEPGEFQVSGYWQYVPFCNLPCVAIKRNYTHNFAKLIKKLGKEKGKKILRTNYVPVEWLEPRIEPFKYNPELDKKQQMPRYFVQLKLAFTPADNKFTVIEQIEDFTLEIPKYVKQ